MLLGVRFLHRLARMMGSCPQRSSAAVLARHLLAGNVITHCHLGWEATESMH